MAGAGVTGQDFAGYAEAFDTTISALYGEEISTNVTGSSTKTATGDAAATEQFVVDQDAIDKVISDILGGNEGLAAILSEEQGAGIFESSVAPDAIGELVAKVAGEIAKLTGTTTQTQTFTETEDQSFETQKEEDNKGLFDFL